ncbi:Hydrogenase maturation protein hypF1 (plasmid) [Cupriavidus taiwanensis]|uniref:Hydrogenase maturation protein hypF1 n=1 Tax=Cupriavidus taiwanensis TaxID=164546 RepID=A0A375FGK1_9BURK|nr:carbamoyltransferase HypF [Cupriavidus taiwanensis]SOZ71265.1 Hydrogenase maturation protein hypF1 [Cupriavidus taiwanensis]SOZ72320.1 Hydrogenase maturation protein hypF1 [Cupriavidus taiwanensis]SOZ74611.1 Hydrogenase maturation protein hypF1 [Cupriavidus taiwanensis]SPA03528.1 Hydrogenase maturation protein hypF1 [Cupriavidus taiwanensis]SPA11426.1 Hydrogenase maturation protein hypF1 [Cupriavidus taiwanensis]
MTARVQHLPHALGDQTVLATGAWLRNVACVCIGGEVHWSPLHGDLDNPAHCVTLDASVAALVETAARAGRPVRAIAHDLHPDFYSTRVALEWGERLGVPTVAVQHHHAHIGAAAAEHGLNEPVVGLALDGVGLGTDGAAWGGELLEVAPAGWRRLGSLAPLALPGGDVAAREPWRMAAAALHALGRSDEIEPRLAAAVGNSAARTVGVMLARGLNCPPSTGAGRWFDAAAGLLGVCLRQRADAEAAIALERLASGYLVAHEAPDVAGLWQVADNGELDLRALLAELLTLADAGEAARGAAVFHLALAEALAHWAAHAAQGRVVLFGGGCFANPLLTAHLRESLAARGVHTLMPETVPCGDAGLALGQAWVAAYDPQVRSLPMTARGVSACA